MEENNEEIVKNEAENVEQLKQIILEQKEKIDEQDDRLKRLMAEFDNSKKRASKERESMYNSIVSDIVTNFLPVMDNLEKAVQTNTEDLNFKQGVELVQKQFTDVLASIGVTPIEAVGMQFDPAVHEAVSSVQDESLGQQIVKEEFRKGYKIGNRVIRHSMVVVAN